MNIIVCLDDFGGMMFNHRRQSRDRTVIRDVEASIGSNRLYMTEYSASLFGDTKVCMEVADDFLDRAGAGDWCFVEDRALSPYAETIETIVVYRWNRHYPSDVKLDLDWKKSGFRLVESIEFSGYSHETITKEIYVK